MAAELTAKSGDDASALPDLLDQIELPIRRFTVDGAYEHRSIYDWVSAAGTADVVTLIPTASLCGLHGAHGWRVGPAPSGSSEDS